MPCGCVTHENVTACSGPVAMPADDYANLRKNEEVVITSITAAVVLLDRWIAYAGELEVENQRLRSKYEAAHERCEMLRELVSELPDPQPVVPDVIATQQVSDPFA